MCEIHLSKYCVSSVLWLEGDLERESWDVKVIWGVKVIY